MFTPKFLVTLAVAAAVAPSTVAAQSSPTGVASQSIATEPLFAEYPVNAISAYVIADAMFHEANNIWSSRGWTVLSNTSDILNEAKPVSGVFAPANVNLTRASAVVDVPAQTLFDYLITPKGYQLIDPGSNSEDFSKPPLESFPTFFWRGIGKADKKRLEVARVESESRPGLRVREFVVLNGIDQTTRLFVSKSVQHRDDPGCSIYGPASCNAISTVPVRALNTFAVQVDPVKGDARKSVVKLINYADLVVPEIPSAVMNQINAVFLVGMVGRMRTYAASTASAASTPVVSA